MKKIAFLSMALIACLVFMFSTVTYGQVWSKDHVELWNVVEQSWTDFGAKDFEATLKTFHEEYKGWNDEAPLPSSKEKVKKFYDYVLLNMESFEFDLSPASITIVDEAAVVHYYFSFTMTFEEGKKHFEGRNSEFYVKDGSKWKLLGDLSVIDDDDDDDD